MLKACESIFVLFSETQKKHHVSFKTKHSLGGKLFVRSH